MHPAVWMNKSTLHEGSTASNHADEPPGTPLDILKDIWTPPAKTQGRNKPEQSDIDNDLYNKHQNDFLDNDNLALFIERFNKGLKVNTTNDLPSYTDIDLIGDVQHSPQPPDVFQDFIHGNDAHNKHHGKNDDLDFAQHDADWQKSGQPVEGLLHKVEETHANVDLLKIHSFYDDIETLFQKCQYDDNKLLSHSDNKFNIEPLEANRKGETKAAQSLITIEEINQLVYQTQPAQKITNQTIKSQSLEKSNSDVERSAQGDQNIDFSDEFNTLVQESFKTVITDYNIPKDESKNGSGGVGEFTNRDTDVEKNAILQQIHQWAYNDAEELRDVRALLYTVGNVLWNGAKWTPMDITICACDKESCKKYYKKAMLTCHPDKHNGAEWRTMLRAKHITQALQAAWARLT
ncbi:uncharacterized protein BXIN_0047 [Babesia sp. Xinjiang]|uniref:uncharacterized protein n=1 Tax=Babesia sp. Xinjiang TaxID=462227 RepID=UPI000A224022|nr:uncharacterized protein BXIN_0047 [Babesia sp. Xinjiang]ORM39707.1 hypothetical protein BXIN_0047 [Babesia sp. Xinjiang]